LAPKIPQLNFKIQHNFLCFCILYFIFKLKTLMMLGSGHQCHNTSLSSFLFAFRSRLRY
jgi:hypothetical protein